MIRFWYWQRGGAGDYIASIGMGEEGCSSANTGACAYAWFADDGKMSVREAFAPNVADIETGNQTAEEQLETYAANRGESLVQVQSETEIWDMIDGRVPIPEGGGILASMPWWAWAGVAAAAVTVLRKKR